MPGEALLFRGLDQPQFDAVTATPGSATLYAMARHARAQILDEDPLLADIAQIVLYPEVWLDTPNDRLGGQPPRALLQTEAGREILYSLVQSVKYGMVT